MSDEGGPNPDNSSSTAGAQDSSASTAAAKPAADKVVVLFQAVGSAPILKDSARKVRVSLSSNVAVLQNYISKRIKQESVFLFVKSQFSPSPVETLTALYKSFGSDGQLTVQYAVQEAWG